MTEAPPSAAAPDAASIEASSKRKRGASAAALSRQHAAAIGNPIATILISIPYIILFSVDNCGETRRMRIFNIKRNLTEINLGRLRRHVRDNHHRCVDCGFPANAV